MQFFTTWPQTQAFRVMRSHTDTAFTRRVDMNTGHSILNEPIELKVMHEIYQRINDGELIRIRKPKEILGEKVKLS